MISKVKVLNFKIINIEPFIIATVSVRKNNHTVTVKVFKILG